MGDRQILLSDSAVWKSIEKTVNFFFQRNNKDRHAMKVADLGCLEGGYAAEFARMGFDTLGIEARAENIRKCDYVKSHSDLRNLTFVKDDARKVRNYGVFDITLCYGLLYHLNDPVHFLEILSKCTSKLLLLNTHFAPEKDIRYDNGLLNRCLVAPIQKHIKYLRPKINYRLSPITENEGYKGRWYKEWNKKEKRESIEGKLWASYNNHQSFWLCKKELTKVLHSVGFDSVFEQFDYTGDMLPDNYTDYYDRTMFVAVKH